MDADGTPAKEAIAVYRGRKLTASVHAVGVAHGADIGSRRVERLAVTHEGIPGERHSGFTRPADSRVPWFKRGEPIHNVRQISLVSVEELAAIAAGLGLDHLEPEWLGANVTLAGIANFSFLPRGTQLFFSSGAVLAVTGQNAPCRIAGKEIEKSSEADAGTDLRFSPVAKRLRGVVAHVDRPGDIGAGDAVSVRVPEQWIWHD